MTEGPVVKRIVVGVDGSEHAARALAWAIRFARQAGADIVAVLAIPPPNYMEYGVGYGTLVTPPELDPEWRAQMTRAFEENWCRPLREAGVGYRTIVEDGRAASVIAAVAEREDADLVVVGRRGRGGVAELLLGSVSHELSHHCTCPVLLISEGPVAEKESEPATAVDA
jgi:nucleotide-binding universal stress UspA family protein